MITGAMHYKETSATKVVQDFLHTAIERSASDIHYEPHHDGLYVRLRIDGILYPFQKMRPSIMQQISSHIKVLAHLNIAQKKVPQDGQFRIIYQQREIDIRVSTFPSIWGEKLVLRILDRKQQPIALDQLGMTPAMHQTFNGLIHKSSGFFLVAGPTGSGKTTTLYAVLNALNSREKNIITLEDPVEYHLFGITQGQIYPPAGFTFKEGMRSLLRQDPDIIMIGEIRDKETAAIAIEAALTGHLVLSTAHTTSAPSVIMRLIDMGIEPFLINAAVTGVLAQRLARKLCQECTYESPLSDQEKEFLKQQGYSLKSAWVSAGCKACNKMGYKGRTGIFELMVMSHELRSLIVKHPSFDEIYQKSVSQNMTTLISDGIEKVKSGLISIAELMRVVN